MVAVTVVISAIIGAFVFDLGDSVSDSSASSNLGVRISENAGDVEVLVTTGTTDRLDLLVDSTVEDSKNDVSPGDTLMASGVATDAKLTVRALNDGKQTVVASETVQDGTSSSISSNTLVVAKDGSEDYTSIDHAVSNSSDDDAIILTGDTYSPDDVLIENNVTIRAEDGANVVLDGSSFGSGSQAFEIGPYSNVVIDDLTIQYYDTAIKADYTEGTWTVKNATLTDNGYGVQAPYTSGAWAVKNSTIMNNANYGIDAYMASTQGDATENWWGDTNPDDQVNGNVSTSPYCDDSSCSSTSP